MGSTLTEDEELDAEVIRGVQSWWKMEESVWSIVRQETERLFQWEGVQDIGKTGTGVRGRDMGIEEGTGKEIGGRRNANATMDMRSYDGWKSKSTTKVRELAKKVLEMRLKMYNMGM